MEPEDPKAFSQLSVHVGATVAALRDVEVYLRGQRADLDKEREALEQQQAALERQRADLSRQLANLNYERDIWHREAALCSDLNAKTQRALELNVGGEHITTTRDTLCSVKGTMLEAMFSGRHKLAQDSDGRFLIDRDAKYFKYVLDYLRDRTLKLPDDEEELRVVLNEFDYFLVPLDEAVTAPARARSRAQFTVDETQRSLTPDDAPMLANTSTLHLHNNTVVCIQTFGHTLVSSSTDCTIRVWDLKNSCCKRTLVGHTGPLWCIQVYKARQIVSSASDQTIRLWDVETGECLKKLEGHTHHVRWVEVYDDDTLVSASGDQTIKVWSLSEGTCVRTLEGHDRAVIFLQVRKASAPIERNVVVSASFDETIRVWDVDTGESVRALTGHTGAVVCLQLFGERRELLASGSYDSTVRVWNVATGACLRVLAGHTDVTRTLHVHENLIVSGSYDSTLRVWDARTGACLRTLTGHTGYIWAVKIWRQHIISGAADHTIKLWGVLPP
eukprot:m51a1_g7624 putative f-box wd repeat-containing protein 7-like (502) ;mRNA; r:305063-307285